MLFIIHGADTYRSRAKLNSFIQEYQTKLGSLLNMHRMDCEETSVGDLKNLCGAESLFSGKKLVVAENFLHMSAEFENVAPSLLHVAESASTILFLWERAIGKDMQKKFANFFTRAKVQEFAECTGAEKQKFIALEAAKRELKLSPQEQGELLLCGDLWGVVNMLDMFSLDRGNALNTRAPLKIFALGDTFHAGRPGDALATLFELLRQGEDEFGIFNYLSGYTRTMLLVKAFAELREPIPAALGIHPFVLKKTASLTRILPFAEIVRAHTNFFEEDARIKTGATTPREALMNMLLLQALKAK